MTVSFDVQYTFYYAQCPTVHEVEWWLGWCSTPMIAEIAVITQDQGEHVANFAILSTKCYLI